MVYCFAGKAKDNGQNLAKREGRDETQAVRLRRPPGRSAQDRTGKLCRSGPPDGPTGRASGLGWAGGGLWRVVLRRDRRSGPADAAFGGAALLEIFVRYER